jgi:hypothetical protein
MKIRTTIAAFVTAIPNAMGVFQTPKFWNPAITVITVRTIKARKVPMYVTREAGP